MCCLRLTAYLLLLITHVTCYQLLAWLLAPCTAAYCALLFTCQEDLFNEDEDEAKLSEAEPCDDEGEERKASDAHGHTDEVRLEGRWQDGMLVTFLRQFETDAESAANAKQETSTIAKERAWLILDGDMYGDWAESLSGMVVKRTLFLSNGEPLQLPPNLTVVIEAQDAANASPTLHAHCAVLSLTEQTIGWKATLRAWVRREEQVPVSSTRQLQRWAEVAIEGTLSTMRKEGLVQCSSSHVISEQHAAHNMLDLLSAILRRHAREQG